jgi:hypothetical protein
MGTGVIVHFTSNDLVQWLQQSLYVTGYIPLLPEAIYHIRQHDYTLLSRMYDSGSSNDTMSWGCFIQ